VHEHSINGQVLHESLPRGESSCVLHLSARTLVARLPNGDVMKMDLRHVELNRGAPDGRQFVYSSTIVGGPTFITEDAELNRAIELARSSSQERAPARSASSGRRRLAASHKLALGGVASVVALVLLAVLLVGPLVRVTLRFIPRAVDSRIGEEAYPHILKQVSSGAAAIERSSVLEPVQSVLDRLTAAVPNNPFFFRVAVCRSPMVNAMALPGGQIIVTTGMLAMLESGEELAGILAHEMNHILYRHVMEETVRDAGLSFLVYAVSRDHPIVGITTSVWSAVGLMSMSREKESQADRQAVHLLAKANIDPKAMLPPFGRLQAEEAKLTAALPESDRKLFEKLSSHPDMGKRIADIEAEIAGIPAMVAPQPIDVDWAALAAAVKALAAEPSPERAPGRRPVWEP
jgi:Zn-dependent protease with chaperone function